MAFRLDQIPRPEKWTFVRTRLFTRRSPASEMTYTVSGGALNSTQSNPIPSCFSAINVTVKAYNWNLLERSTWIVADSLHYLLQIKLRITCTLDACGAVAVDVNQELCREWSAKPAADKQFDPFYRAVSAVAFSSGIKLKTHAVVLNTVWQSCVVSSNSS